MKQIPLTVFILGMLWAAASAAASAGPLLLYQLSQHHVDWSAIAWVAGPAGLFGAGGFVKKYQALLQLPPDLQMARELAQQVTTTTKTTEDGTTTKTVEKTTVQSETITGKQ